MSKKVVLIKVRRPEGGNVNADLQWLGNSLGLFNLRDKDSSCFRIFITLVRKSSGNNPVSSDEIAEKLDLSRGTVVHHLAKLMDCGIVIHEKEGYLLREQKLAEVINDLHKDVESLFDELRKVAQEVDQQLR